MCECVCGHESHHRSVECVAQLAGGYGGVQEGDVDGVKRDDPWGVGRQCSCRLPEVFTVVVAPMVGVVVVDVLARVSVEVKP